jgi:hypothetical protein
MWVKKSEWNETWKRLKKLEDRQRDTHSLVKLLQDRIEYNPIGKPMVRLGDEWFREDEVVIALIRHFDLKLTKVEKKSYIKVVRMGTKDAK